MGSNVRKQVSLRLSEWGNLELTAIHMIGEGVYFPVKMLCFALIGGVDDRAQRARIQRDEVLNALARKLPVDTPGGQQDMLCLERLGLARWINGLNLNQVRADIRGRILQFQWDLTYLASQILWGEIEATQTAPPMILPSSLALTPRKAADVTLHDADVQRLLYALAGRIGHIEMSQREIQGLIVALASGETDAIARRCPQCGYVFSEE